MWSDIDFCLGWSLNIFGSASIGPEFFGGIFDLLEDAISSLGGLFNLGFK